MTLEAIEYIIVDLALRNNLVNSAFAGGSIYSLNSESIKEYPFIFVSPAGTHTEKFNTTRYSLVIYYADRLEQDSSNETTVASVAIETLKNIKRQLAEFDFVVEVQPEADIRLFTETEKMSDRLTGAYLTFWIEVLNVATCPTYFDETGAPLGNYIYPEIPVNVLDNLASKEWVLKKIREIGGVTIEDVDNEIDRKLRPYATIRYVDDAIAAISGSTPEISGLTHDVQVLSAATQSLSAQTEENAAQITAITAQVSILSGFTHESVSSLTQSIETLSEAISAATPADYAEVKAQVSANTEDIQVLSGYTGTLFTDVHDLTTGFTNLEGQITAVTSDFSTLAGQVTANTQNIQNLSASTTNIKNSLSGYTTHAEFSAATSGYTTQIAALSATTSGLSSQIAGKQNILSGSTHIRVQNDVVSSIDLVASSTVATIWTGSQVDYDLIATKDPHTVYIVV